MDWMFEIKLDKMFSILDKFEFEECQNNDIFFFV